MITLRLWEHWNHTGNSLVINETNDGNLSKFAAPWDTDGDGTWNNDVSSFEIWGEPGEKAVFYDFLSGWNGSGEDWPVDVIASYEKIDMYEMAAFFGIPNDDISSVDIW